MAKTKIVCTLGPASSDEQVIADMLRSGMDVARLNFSHGTHEGHARMLEKFRPDLPIIAATPDAKTYHQLALSWGVYPVRALYQENEESLTRHAIDCARISGLVGEGERVVVTGGGRDSLMANALRIETVPAAGKDFF
jgi:pyruvate kinase